MSSRSHASAPIRVACVLMLALVQPQLAAPELPTLRWPATAFATPPFRPALPNMRNRDVCEMRSRKVQGGAGQYVRLIERSDGFDLATSQISLVSERNETLTLVATIHLGERRYFEQLQVHHICPVVHCSILARTCSAIASCNNSITHILRRTSRATTAFSTSWWWARSLRRQTHLVCGSWDRR